MNPLAEVEKLLSGLTRAEKAQVLQWTVRDLGDGNFPLPVVLEFRRLGHDVFPL